MGSSFMNASYYRRSGGYTYFVLNFEIFEFFYKMSLRNRRRRGSPYKNNGSGKKIQQKSIGFDLGTIVLVRINEEGWIEARVTRRSGDGTYDVQTTKEGRLLSSVSPTCVRLPPKMDLSSKRREMLAPLWWEHWGSLTGASVWTACAQASLFVLAFHCQIPSSLSNVLTWYSILSVVLYVVCSYAKRLPFDAARKVTAIASLSSWALSAFAAACAIQAFLSEIWNHGLGQLFYLPFAPVENMTYKHITSVCLFCISQGAVIWTHAVFGVLTTGYRPNMYVYLLFFLRSLICSLNRSLSLSLSLSLSHTHTHTQVCTPSTHISNHVSS
jgi:hypothetical protein